MLFSTRKAIIWEAVLCSQPTCIPHVYSLPTCTSTGSTYHGGGPCADHAGGSDLVLEVVVADPRVPLLPAVCRFSRVRLAGSGVCGFWLGFHL